MRGPALVYRRDDEKLIGFQLSDKEQDQMLVFLGKLRGLNKPERKRAPRPTKEQVVAAQDLWRQGYVVKEIAHRTGLTEGQLGHLIAKDRDMFPRRNGVKHGDG
jgi:hypothetical protein